MILQEILPKQTLYIIKTLFNNKIIIRQQQLILRYKDRPQKPSTKPQWSTTMCTKQRHRQFSSKFDLSTFKECQNTRPQYFCAQQNIYCSFKMVLAMIARHFFTACSRKVITFWLTEHGLENTVCQNDQLKNIRFVSRKIALNNTNTP